MTRRYRLLQARDPKDPVREEERASFAARLRVDVDRLEPHDLLSMPTTLSTVTEGVDAVLVGGSGRYSVLDKTPWMPDFIGTLGELANTGFPTFASCFGFQGMVLALGGHVQTDEENAEVGTFQLELTTEAASDPLFASMPHRFSAQEGHKDRATEMPPSATVLAGSKRCPYQAMRVGDAPVYATQFHPELTGADNRFRFQRYLKLYSKVFGPNEADRMLEGFQDSPHTVDLLFHFSELL